jgi:hypothetical protein
MPWTYAQLKAAYAALSPAPADNAAAATALNTQTTTLPPQDVMCSDARQVILLTGEWVAIKALASQTVSSFTAPTPSDQAIIAAATCVAALDPSSNIESLAVSDDAVWASVQTMLGGLHASGVLSTLSLNALTALRTPTIPTWDPPVTAEDVATATRSS